MNWPSGMDKRKIHKIFKKNMSAKVYFQLWYNRVLFIKKRIFFVVTLNKLMYANLCLQEVLIKSTSSIGKTCNKEAEEKFFLTHFHHKCAPFDIHSSESLAFAWCYNFHPGDKEIPNQEDFFFIFCADLLLLLSFYKFF